MTHLFNSLGAGFSGVWTLLRQITLISLSGISLIALILVLDAFFPRWIRRTQVAIEKQPGASFLLGLVNMLFFGSMTVFFSLVANYASPIFLGPALLINIPLTAATVIGVVGLVRFAGERLFPEQQDRKRMIYTVSLLFVASLTPVIGWFLLTSYIVVMGFGGFLLGFLRYRNHAEAAVSTEAPALDPEEEIAEEETDVDV
jgi:hypothetical protein